MSGSSIATSDGLFTATYRDGELVDASFEPPEPRPSPPEGQVWADEAGLPDCRIYWGSHGCNLARGHDGDHWCDCCDCDDHAASQGHRRDDDGSEWFCVATAPYYGSDTRFYGEDV